MGPATFYTVSNARYFVGTVGLLNSLRLTGNAGELVVLDAGLTGRQRARLEPHCRVVEIPADLATTAVLFKAFPFHLQPSGLVVVIDSDIIVTGPLDGIVAAAERGAICAVPDRDDDRWYGEWEDRFGLTGPPRRQTYVNSGFVALSTLRWPGLLQRWWEVCQRIPSPETRTHGSTVDSPFWDADQDALNAILMSEVPAEGLMLLPYHRHPAHHADRRRTEVRDARTLACSHEGEPTAFVHYVGKRKAWESEGAWRRGMRDDAYVRLMPRVLLAEDVPVRLAASELPRLGPARRRREAPGALPGRPASDPRTGRPARRAAAGRPDTRAAGQVSITRGVGRRG